MKMVKKLYQFLQNYSQRTQHYSPVRFTIEISFISIIVKFFFGILFVALFSLAHIDLGEPNSITLQKEIHNPYLLFLSVCVVAPFVETLFFQGFIITLLNQYKVQTMMIFIVATVLFALAHLDWNFFTFVAILPLSMILTWAFIVQKRISWWRAFWIVAIIHSVNNLMALLLLQIPT